MSTRTPPHNLEAEAASLGAMLLDSIRVVPIATQRMKLPPEAWYSPAHATIANALFEVYNRDGMVDVLTVQEELTRTGKLEIVGGAIALDTLVDKTPTASNAEYYLDIVRQKWILRREVALCRDIEEEAYEQTRGDEHLKSIATRFSELVGSVIQVVSNRDVMDKTIKGWEEAKKHEKPAIGLETPWPNLTQLLCGLEKGVTILAGRPSAGKTTVEDQICIHNAAKGIPVARVTLDSSVDELLSRALCRKAGVSLPKLKFGYAGESQLARVRETRDLIADYPMWINDQDRDWRPIATWSRMMKAKYGIQLLTIDYIQLIGASEMGRSEWDANTRVSYVSSQCKKLSFELDIPVLVLSQLSRGVEKDNRQPKLSDLRDSGAIEQDASKVIFAYRDEDVYAGMEQRTPGSTKHTRPTWLDVLKHKNGETGRIPYWLHAPYFRLEEVDDFNGLTEEDMEGLMAGGNTR
jgi:replicative DNA helicase